jgi:hypothetical protein
MNSAHKTSGHGHQRDPGHSPVVIELEPDALPDPQQPETRLPERRRREAHPRTGVEKYRSRPGRFIEFADCSLHAKRPPCQISTRYSTTVRIASHECDAHKCRGMSAQTEHGRGSEIRGRVDIASKRRPLAV